MNAKTLLIAILVGIAAGCLASGATGPIVHGLGIGCGAAGLYLLDPRDAGGALAAVLAAKGGLNATAAVAAATAGVVPGGLPVSGAVPGSDVPAPTQGSMTAPTAQPSVSPAAVSLPVAGVADPTQGA